jgi:hypothetical protein
MQLTFVIFYFYFLFFLFFFGALLCFDFLHFSLFTQFSSILQFRWKPDSPKTAKPRLAIGITISISTGSARLSHSLSVSGGVT